MIRVGPLAVCSGNVLLKIGLSCDLCIYLIAFAKDWQSTWPCNWAFTILIVQPSISDPMIRSLRRSTYVGELGWPAFSSARGMCSRIDGCL